MSGSDFDRAVETYREALGDFVAGDPGAVMRLFSRRADVTLANPLAPPASDREDVEKAIKAAAANFSGGTVRVPRGIEVPDGLTSATSSIWRCMR